VFDLAAALDTGCRVCLGTDGASSNNALDMFREMYLMALLPKGLRRDPTRPAAKECLSIASRNGALAMGYEDVGLLKPGFRADWVLLGDEIGLMPGADTAADIVYAAGSGFVRMTAVNGRVLYREGEFPGMDIQRLKARCREHARALGVEKA
jgi:5-methylthioadenosine/S-adenosylhomocysteine deaminase